SADIYIKGYSTHPGSAKNRMRNAIRIAFELDSMLPMDERPENTEGHEGFYHVDGIRGTVEHTEIGYILRDHDYAKLEQKIEKVKEVAAKLNEKYGAGTVTADIKHTYDNMEKALRPYPQLMKYAEQAVKAAGGEVIKVAVRGGTDGSRLSYMGLPCPNLGAGGYVAHSTKEFACCEEMESASDMLVKLAELFAVNH
ncbi:MAG: peptidase dimerization domain-containing protein, partial [Oscillospiraceae bacterium]